MMHRMHRTKHNLRPIWVDVRAKIKGGELDWRVKWKRSKWNPFWNEGPIDLPAGSGAHEIMFDLDDDTGLGLRFLEPPDEAIWVMPDTCPQGKCNQGGQITPVSVEDQGKRLRVINANSGQPVELHYALNFDGTRSAHGPPYCHDPIIKNRGG
jgi:hypothetical protein